MTFCPTRSPAGSEAWTAQGPPAASLRASPRPRRPRFPLVNVLPVVLFRFAARNAQRLPFRHAKVFSDENDLADVVRIMCDLPVDSLQHAVRFASNRHRASHIFWLDRF